MEFKGNKVTLTCDEIVHLLIVSDNTLDQVDPEVMKAVIEARKFRDKLHREMQKRFEDEGSEDDEN